MPAPRVAVLDYDAGNLRSAQKALVRAGADAVVTRDPDEAARADALVVPGVGHFGACVRRFVAAGLSDLVHGWVAAGRPLLGICVGMQILYPSSEEDPDAVGIGLLPEFLCRQGLATGRLKAVLTEWTLPPAAELYAVFPAELQADSRVQCFVDFLAANLIPALAGAVQSGSDQSAPRALA